jgi:trehalose 6-phosphate synthase/phosphatase
MVRGRPVNVETFPLGIDVDRFAGAAGQPEAQADIVDLRRQTQNRKVILSVDRLDFTKGIPQRLEAYGRFLEDHPDWHNRVTLIAICVPSRVRVPEYQALKRQVDELVGRINGQFAQPGWMPIWYLYRALPFERLIPMYLLADVAMVTPLRDGMNLVAKEYLATRTDETGVLVLSETAGAADELSEALILNPHDEQGMVNALHDALQMPVKEQKARNQPMRTRLRRYNTVRWANDFLARLEVTAQLYLTVQREQLSGELRQKLLQQYRESERRLLLLDYDGTLVSFVRRPTQAVPDADLLAQLQRLATHSKNTVVIISGRDEAILEEWLGDTGVNLVAEHGAKVRLAGQKEWLQTDFSRAEEWKSQLWPLLEVYADRTPGALVEEKPGSLAWHYRGADPEIGSLRAKELINALEGLVANTSLHLLHGNKVVEVKSSNISKGTAVQRWLIQQPGFDFILAIGDDVTDEYLFAVMPDESWTIKVGPVKNTRARFYVSGPVEVRQLLQELSGL